MEKGKNILVIGSGGREHAICWKLSQSNQVQTIFCAPGSFGITQTPKVVIVSDFVINNHNVSIVFVICFDHGDISNSHYHNCLECSQFLQK